MTALPLAGTRVVDLTHFVAGPWCTMLLADLGADVVKIEPPGTGEIARRMGAVRAGGESAIYLAFNRNKRSVAVDLKEPDGRAAARDMVVGADVVVHNFRPAAARRLGMDGPTLTERHPRLVHCAISAFGPDGPYTERPGNDPIIQALSGAMLLGRAPGERPARMGVSLPDFAAGVLAAASITAALLRRTRTGRGAMLELNLLDTEMFAQIDHVLRVATGVGTPTDTPTDLPVRALTEAFAARAHTTVTVDHPDVAALRSTRTPIDATPPWPVEYRPPPRLGQHTAEVLAELGYTGEELDGLVARGVAGPVETRDE